ncbi:MAG: PrsW family intramembrane metalloprotease [Ignavibacteria bacterium]|nr:PrsW family intramembrane metalloprotease [Ignavibacteria bacterium]
MSFLVLMALAVAPGLAIAIYVYWRDKFEREPLSLMVKCFVLGMVSIIPAILLELLGTKVFGNYSPDNFFQTAFHAFVIVGLSEEWSKYLFLKGYAYRKSDFNEPYDGITYSVMVSMGFATLENIMYVAQGGFEVAILRMFLSVPAHATFGVIMGYYVGLAKFRQHSLRLRMIGLFLAMLFHGAYDFCLFLNTVSYLVLGALASLIIGVVLSLKAIKHHAVYSPFNPTHLESPSDSLV